MIGPVKIMTMIVRTKKSQAKGVILDHHLSK